MQTLLALHNIGRWGFVIFGLYAITKCILGLVKNQEYTKSHNLSAVLFVAFTHLQLLLGFILYFGKGWAENFSDMGNAMGNATLRFFTVEHTISMLLAIILIQIGRTKSKKAEDARSKHKKALIFFSIGFIIALAMIPWPFRGEVARALWPSF
ncbi:hypothetical protein GYB22_11160 [bacterium]|nr:hypothetical protein [bacterium]